MDNNKPPITLDDLDKAPSGLPVQNNIDWHSRYLELMDRFITITDESFSLKEENSKLKSANKTRTILDELILPFAKKTFYFMCCYCGVVGFFLFLHGFGLDFKLPDSVLDFLVGSTAVTVIGLVGMVLTGVFVGGGKR